MCPNNECSKMRSHDYNDVWRCCSCGASNLEANADTMCPVCGHRRCARCEGTRRSQHCSSSPQRNQRSERNWALDEVLAMIPSPRPNETTNNPIGGAHIKASDVIVMMVHDYKPYAPKPAYPNFQRRQRYNGLSGGSHLLGKGEMTDWWYCHPYNHLNNPRLSPERCSQCNHRKCESCTVLQD